MLPKAKTKKTGVTAKGGKSPRMAIAASPEFQAGLAKAAESLGISVSELVRLAVADWIKSKFDSFELKETMPIPKTFEELLEYSTQRRKILDEEYYREIEHFTKLLKSFGEGKNVRERRITQEDGEWASPSPKVEPEK